ncbi:MAG: hypothetical protein R2860_05665 [Desulfobacterales bacterium]
MSFSPTASLSMPPTILFRDHHDRQQLAEEIDWVIGLGSGWSSL